MQACEEPAGARNSIANLMDLKLEGASSQYVFSIKNLQFDSNKIYIDGTLVKPELVSSMVLRWGFKEENSETVYWVQGQGNDLSGKVFSKVVSNLENLSFQPVALPSALANSEEQIVVFAQASLKDATISSSADVPADFVQQNGAPRNLQITWPLNSSWMLISQNNLLKAVASDPNPDDRLSYQWAVASGFDQDVNNFHLFTNLQGAAVTNAQGLEVTSISDFASLPAGQYTLAVSAQDQGGLLWQEG